MYAKLVLCVMHGRNLSEISREGEGGLETEGGSQLFETAEKGGVMKNAPLKGGGHANMCP